MAGAGSERRGITREVEWMKSLNLPGQNKPAFSAQISQVVAFLPSA